MDFKVREDIEYFKQICKYSDDKIASDLDVSRMTLNRWMSSDEIDFNSLEKIYSLIYKNGIRINKLKDEYYNSFNDSNTLILYHGAKNDIIGKPSILYSGKNKDFGQGFYLGETLENAGAFVASYDTSSVYIFRLNNYKELKIKEFSVSIEWMLLIAYFRGNLENYKDSKKIKDLLNEIEGVDIIIAPIADNTMYSILNEFIEGEITDLQCLHALSANRLGKQFVIKNDKIINNNLELMERCFLCNMEKEDFTIKKDSDSKIGRDKVIFAKRKFAGIGNYVEMLLND